MVNIGDELIKSQGVNGGARYIVIGYSSVPENSLILECQSCAHGYKCKVVVEPEKPEVYKFYSMYGAQEDDEEHEAFHKTYDEFDMYFTSKKAYKDAQYTKQILFLIAEKGKAMKRVDAYEKKIQELVDKKKENHNAN